MSIDWTPLDGKSLLDYDIYDEVFRAVRRRVYASGQYKRWSDLHEQWPTSTVFAGYVSFWGSETLLGALDGMPIAKNTAIVILNKFYGALAACRPYACDAKGVLPDYEQFSASVSFASLTGEWTSLFETLQHYCDLLEYFALSGEETQYKVPAKYIGEADTFEFHSMHPSSPPSQNPLIATVRAKNLPNVTGAQIITVYVGSFFSATILYMPRFHSDWAPNIDAASPVESGVGQDWVYDLEGKVQGGMSSVQTYHLEPHYDPTSIQDCAPVWNVTHYGGRTECVFQELPDFAEPIGVRLLSPLWATGKTVQIAKPLVYEGALASVNQEIREDAYRYGTLMYSELPPPPYPPGWSYWPLIYVSVAEMDEDTLLDSMDGRYEVWIERDGDNSLYSSGGIDGSGVDWSDEHEGDFYANPYAPQSPIPASQTLYKDLGNCESCAIDVFASSPSLPVDSIVTYLIDGSFGIRGSELWCHTPEVKMSPIPTVQMQYFSRIVRVLD